jgi:hypothetical protein
MIPLTADLFAHAVVAAARAYGDDPIDAFAAKSGILKRCRAPAAVAASRVAGIPLGRASAILGMLHTNVSAARGRGGGLFQKAQDAAEAACRAYLAANAPKPAAEAPARASAQVRAPAPPSKPLRPPAGRAIPRGARFQNLGEGVSIIRLKPISDSILRHARQQVEGGLTVEEAAEFFDVCPDSLKKRLEGVSA